MTDKRGTNQRRANDPALPKHLRARHASGLIFISLFDDGTVMNVTCPVCESGLEVSDDETIEEVERMSTAIREIRRGRSK